MLGATRSFTRREKATVTACAESSTPSLQSSRRTLKFSSKADTAGLRGEAWQAHGGEGQGAEDQQCRRTVGTSSGGDRTLSCHGRFHQGGGNEVGRNRRAALRKLVSSVYLESDLNLPFRKNGKFLFQLGYTPVVSDMKKIVQKTAALSFPKWALAVWDMDTATLYMVKYDRSH